LPIANVAEKISLAPVNENPQEATNRIQTYRLALPRGGSQSGAERREHGGKWNYAAVGSRQGIGSLLAASSVLQFSVCPSHQKKAVE